MLIMAPALTAQDVVIDGPEVVLRHTPFTVKISAPRALEPVPIRLERADGRVLADTVVMPFDTLNVHGVMVDASSKTPLRVMVAGTAAATLDAPVLPGLLSVLPPLLAIVMALVFREVVTSLFAGVWLGSLFLTGFNPLTAVFLSANRFAREALADPNHATIILFTMLLGGMVGLVTRMGGLRAIVDAVVPLATNRRRAQVAAWLAGVAVFFDDYANSLVVGNTMRPLTDRMRVSREKLAYIVDSTAAPVAAVFFISTWIGYEVSMIDGGLTIAAGQQSADPALAARILAVNPFRIFLSSIPYLFYPLLAILAVAVVAISGRDFGPMLAAERRAEKGDGVHRPGAQLAADIGEDLAEVPNAPPGRWWNGFLPVAVLVITTLAGLVVTGLAALGPDDPHTLKDIFGGADPYSPLMWGSMLAGLTAIGLAVGQRIMRLGQAINAFLAGARSMLLAIVILLLAWSLGEVTSTLGTASFLAGALSDTMPPVVFPAAVFVVSAMIAFATGTSWATMAILLPLVVPLAVVLAGGIGGPGTQGAILYGGIGSVLAGSIMGDHCSPISDTTVLSSTASSCDHVDHVRTQLPYALAVSVISLMFGSLPTAMGLSVWAALPLAALAVVLVFRIWGRPVVEEGG